MHTPRRGGFSILLTLAIAAIVGVLAYNAGLQAGATAGATPGTVVVYGAGGIGFFGFLLFLVLIGLLFRLFARPRVPWGGPGMWMSHGAWGGHGRWHGSTDEGTRPDFPPFVAEMHRRMHEQSGTPTDRPTADRPTDTPGA
jgi:hypothetical protein